jgi:hypothetical protein
MNESLFIDEIDQWLRDVRGECLSLHEKGVPTERLLGIATAIADSLAIKRALGRQQLSGVAPAPFRRLHS